MTTRRRTESAPPPEPEVAELKARIEQLELSAEEAGNRFLRLAADFDNYKKRAREDQLDTINYASATIVERLLPVLDDFQRVLDHAPEGVDGNWLKGVGVDDQRLQECWTAQGVERSEALGNAFER